MFSSILRSLRGSNLEIFKFGMYIMFPIGWMYYFGTNLEDRFSVPGFWPTQAQGHKIPFEKEDIRAEVERINKGFRDKARREETDRSLAQAKETFGRARGGEVQGEG